MKLLNYILFSIFNFVEKPPYGFPQWLHQFMLPPVAHKGPFFFTFSAALFIACLFDNSHSDRCEMISPTGFVKLVQRPHQYIENKYTFRGTLRIQTYKWVKQSSLLFLYS